MELDGDVSLYHPVSGRAVVLNATASDVWRLVDGELTLDEIVELLAKSYRAEPDSIRPDVERVVRELTEHGFLAG
jgi:coenzyme PQQ synthesis protein D (PqqD)